MRYSPVDWSTSQNNRCRPFFGSGPFIVMRVLPRPSFARIISSAMTSVSAA